MFLKDIREVIKYKLRNVKKTNHYLLLEMKWTLQNMLEVA